MFAPDPGMSITRVSAEYSRVDGQTVAWDSPSWRTFSTAERFRRFREINYFDRLLKPQNVMAFGDFGSYLLRGEETSGPQTVRRLGETRESRSARSDALDFGTVQFFKQSRRLIPPDDGSFPTVDEATWMSSSEPISNWSVLP
jgi:hypothetical protein